MPTVTRQEVLLVAAEAIADPRTVARVLRGEKIRGEVLKSRIAEAARALGIPLPDATTTPIKG